MKPILLNTNDINGGAAKAAYRLHCGLKDMGVNSLMLVGQKHSEDTSVISRWNKPSEYLRPRLDMLPLKLYRERKLSVFHPAYLPEGLAADTLSYNPQIIHLHWICSGYLRIETLKRFHKPIVWTLHDMWAFTGGCHYDEECGRYRDRCGNCPQLNSERENDLSRWVWNRKRKSWQDVDITIVTPSRWLAESARRSSLFQHRRIEIIPYGLDTELYKPIDKKTARQRLQLPQDKRLILFGAINASHDRRKGFQYLQPALQKLVEKGWSKDVELVIFGAAKPDNPPQMGMESHYMGHIDDELSMASLYCAVDLFVLPSTQDNLPNTIMESLACGTPVVAFDVGGVSDMVEHQVNGYLVKAMDADDFVKGLDWVLGDRRRLKSLGIAAREKAVSEYSTKLQAKRYLDLYEEITGK